MCCFESLGDVILWFRHPTKELSCGWRKRILFMASDSLDNRLQELKRALRQLQQRVDRLLDPNRRWGIEDAGRFAHDPIFDQTVRL
jgi:hypothetical protein